MKFKTLLLFILFFLLGAPLFAQRVFYVAASGSDTNNGTTKATPWSHAPGMPNCANNCASTTPVAGDQYIFRGGDTWNFGNSAASPYTGGTWTWHWGGTSSTSTYGCQGSGCIYVGIDTTWFSGSSFTRPIFTGGNSPSTGFVTACAFSNNGGSNNFIFLNITSGSFMRFDGFEMTGFCWTGNTGSGSRAFVNVGFGSGQTNIEFSRNYCHGWTMLKTADDNYPCWATFGGGSQNDFTRWDYNVIDGVDSPHFASGAVLPGTTSSPACQYVADGNVSVTNVSENSSNVVSLTYSGSTLNSFNGGSIGMQGLTVATWLNNVPNIILTSATSTIATFTDPTHHGTLASTAEVGVAGMSGCASGQFINGSHSRMVDHNVARYLSNIIVSNNYQYYNDNLFEYLWGTFGSANQQHPNVLNNLGGSTGQVSAFFNNTVRNTYATEAMYLSVVTSEYIFNNILYNNMQSVFGPFPVGCIRINNTTSSATNTNVYIYNNIDDNTCSFTFDVANSPLTAFNGTGNFENDQFIGSNTTLSQMYNCATTGTCTINNLGSNLFQSVATATSQGYVASNYYLPANGTGSTVGVGANLTSSCGTFSLNNELCSSSTAGVVEQVGWGGMIAVSPAATSNARPGSGAWDIGAGYWTSGGTPAPVTSNFSIILSMLLEQQNIEIERKRNAK
jgi:hypothetical protein